MPTYSTRRRSPLAPPLRERRAVFTPFGEDAALVETLSKSRALPTKSRASESRLLLCDLSPLTRVGVKGQGVESLLRRSGLVAPKAVNESVVQKNGSLCLRLAAQEVLLLSALDSKGTRDFVELRKNLAQTQHGKRNVFSVPYQDSLCWLALAGEGASDVLATMCAVDLGYGIFSRGSLAQTSLARLGALVLRDPASSSKLRRSGVPLFHLLVDSASALYLWDCLLDAILNTMGGVGHDGVVCGRQDLLGFLAMR